jgi:hypothetical protein
MQSRAMKMKWLACLLLCAVLPLATGCRGTVAGSNRAGVPFLQDTIESRYNRTVDKVQVAAREALAFNGTITSDDSVTRTLQAQINNRRVFVKVEELEPQVTRVLVQVFTKGGGADIHLAAEIDKQIALRLK